MLTLESRNSKLDGRDVELLDVLRARGHVSGLRIEHVRGESDPRLWVPDQVLGAYGDELVGRKKNQRWESAWHRVKESVDTLEVSLR